MDDLKLGTENLNEGKKSPLESLKERMKTIQSGPDVPEADGSDAGFTINVEEESTENAAPQEPADEISEPVAGETKPAHDESGEVDEVEETQEENPKETEDGKGKRSFLRRMRRFTTNENGDNVFEIEKPAYELEPVEKIIGAEEDGNDENAESAEKDGQEQIADGEETATPEEEPNVPYLSDIDVPANNAEEETEEPDAPVTADTATIRFTPISDTTAKSSAVAVDTMTHRFDLGGEFSEKSGDTENELEDLEESEFDKYIPAAEITSRNDEKHFMRDFAVKKRNRFLATVGCGILTFVLIIFLILSINSGFYSQSSGWLIAPTIIFGLIMLLNADMFVSAAKAVPNDFNVDFCAALASLSTVALAAFSIRAKENCFPVILVCAILLFIRSLSNFYAVSNYYGNLKVISVTRPKNAAYFISDESTTVAMARDSIEGKVMVATGRKTDRVTDFMKYSDFGTKLFGKGKIISLVSVALAVVSAVIAGIVNHSAVEAFYISSVILCMAALPTAFFIDVLPLRSAATRLNKIGAMLTGYAGADKLNRANAAVIRTADIFPHGSVVLKEIKLLSDNNVDDIILRAASLTDAVSSPLSNIFKQIAKTNAAYDVPDSDTVKYEKRMGISGWVNDELMFIGNRTLLQAHGIGNIPDLEVDREILKRGFFPVYVATDNKACVLLIVKYSADPAIARQLRKAANLGITLLIDNSDPNVTNEMVCDYFDLYEDSVSVMNGAGSSAHRAATVPTAECSAPAAYRGNSMSLLQIMSCAANIKKSNLMLTVIYVIAAVIGAVYFIYNLFLGNMSVAQRGNAALIFVLASTAISLAAFAFKKP